MAHLLMALYHLLPHCSPTGIRYRMAPDRHEAVTQKQGEFEALKLPSRQHKLGSNKLTVASGQIARVSDEWQLTEVEWNQVRH